MYDQTAILKISAALDPAAHIGHERQGSGAPLYPPRNDNRATRYPAKRSQPTYELPRESYHDDSGRPVRGVARQVPSRRSSYQGSDTVSQQFKIGLMVILAMAVGSILFHLVWPV